uniref:Uncharacterized protein n=1 Tax=Triticum urartu TaxID=4572 RepID=A0A8R7V049_TRIUA
TLLFTPAKKVQTEAVWGVVNGHHVAVPRRDKHLGEVPLGLLGALGEVLEHAGIQIRPPPYEVAQRLTPAMLRSIGKLPAAPIPWGVPRLGGHRRPDNADAAGLLCDILPASFKRVSRKAHPRVAIWACGRGGGEDGDQDGGQEEGVMLDLDAILFFLAWSGFLLGT